MSDKLKVAVLYDVWGEEDIPESEKAAESGRKRKEKEDREENAAPLPGRSCALPGTAPDGQRQ